MTTEMTKEITLGDDFGAVAITVNGRRIEIGADGGVEIKPANGNTMTAIAAAQKALEIGDRMKDGTVVIAVDLENNIALFVPEGIFGGNARFEDQYDVVEKADAQKLHGHTDWRLITDNEASALAKAWGKVAPPALQGEAAPYFWGLSADQAFYSASGRIYRGGMDGWFYSAPRNLYPVPIVRRGPARS